MTNEVYFRLLFALLLLTSLWIKIQSSHIALLNSLLENERDRNLDLINRVRKDSEKEAPVKIPDKTRTMFGR